MKAHDEMVSQIASVICKKSSERSYKDCSQLGNNSLCGEGICKIDEKTPNQLKYILSDLNKNIFLSACPGSGKTEVVAIKAAYEIARWPHNFSGIAFLTFTNNAKDVIWDRVHSFLGYGKLGFPHYIGTIDSWIHRFFVQPLVYSVTKFQGRDGDYSIQIIDEKSKSSFLNNFQTEKRYEQGGHIKANQFYFDLYSKEFVFLSNYGQNGEIRNKINLTNEQKHDLGKAKNRFFENGFATYADMEYLCYKLLCNEAIGRIISQRFSRIIVDECQDLSGNQLKILDKMKYFGSSLHFIGDLDQSIYGFKGVNPSSIKNYIEDCQFKKMNLSKSFRSSQQIMDICQKLVNGGGIVGNSNPTINFHPTYIQYKDDQIDQLPYFFESIINNLQNKEISINNSAILARNRNLMYKLRGVNKFEKDIITLYLPYSINLWKKKNLLTLSQLSELLDNIGKFISTKQMHKCSFNSRELSWFTVKWKNGNRVIVHKQEA